MINPQIFSNENIVNSEKKTKDVKIDFVYQIKFERFQSLINRTPDRSMREEDLLDDFDERVSHVTCQPVMSS